MLGPEGLLEDRQRPLIERLGLGVPALGLVEQGQVVEALGHVRVLGPEGLLEDRQRPLIKRLGLGVPALGLVEQGQVVEALGQATVLRAETFRFF